MSLDSFKTEEPREGHPYFIYFILIWFSIKHQQFTHCVSPLPHPISHLVFGYCPLHMCKFCRLRTTIRIFSVSSKIRRSILHAKFESNKIKFRVKSKFSLFYFKPRKFYSRATPPTFHQMNVSNHNYYWWYWFSDFKKIFIVLEHVLGSMRVYLLKSESPIILVLVILSFTNILMGLNHIMTQLNFRELFQQFLPFKLSVFFSVFLILCKNCFIKK